MNGSTESRCLKVSVNLEDEVFVRFVWFVVKKPF
jgi:hypothetical protein